MSADSGFKIPPNLDQKNLALISHFLDMAAVCYAKGDLGTCFKYLKGTKVKVGASISKEELLKLKKLELNISMWISKYQYIDMDHIFTAEINNKKINSKIEPLIEDYEIEIRRTLNKLFGKDKGNDGY